MGIEMEKGMGMETVTALGWVFGSCVIAHSALAAAARCNPHPTGAQLLNADLKRNGKGNGNGNRNGTGMGLRIMRYRAQCIGGRCEVQSTSDGGAIVKCRVPLPTQFPIP